MCPAEHSWEWKALDRERYDPLALLASCHLWDLN